MLICIITIILAGTSHDSLNAQSDLESEVHSYLANIPFEMPRIGVPSFPDRTFNIVDFGAIGDGHTLNTDMFAETIQSCVKAGGGKIIVPQGIWLTGPIRLESNIELHLEQGAMILFTPDRTQYPIIETPSRGFLVTSPIYGFHLDNVAITGSGIIDGSGDAWRPVKKFKTTSSQWKQLLASGGIVNPEKNMWWPSQQALDGESYLKDLHARKEKSELVTDDFLPARDYMRPYMVLFVHCKNVLVDGVTIRNSPKFALVPNWSENIIIRDVKVNNEWWAQNGDGIDISSCKNVLIYKCIVSVGDDAICMKSDKKKNSDEPSLQNIVIADCFVYHGHGGFVIGSNTDGGVKNISVKNCNFINTDIGLRFKSARDRGGLVEQIYMTNIYMSDIVNEAILFDTYYENVSNEGDYPITETTPQFRHFYFRDIICVDARQAVLIAGLPEMPIRDIEMTGLRISAERGFGSSHASNFTLNNVTIDARDKCIYSLQSSNDFVIENGTVPQDARVFVKLSGIDNSNIRLKNIDLSSVAQPFEYYNGATEKTVIIE